MTNYFILRKLFKLIRYSFSDGLFYLVLLDIVLTLFIVKSGIGIEANPIVNYLGFTNWIILTFVIYFLCSAFGYKKLIKYILIIWYIIINIIHIYQIFIYYF